MIDRRQLTPGRGGDPKGEGPHARTALLALRNRMPTGDTGRAGRTGHFSRWASRPCRAGLHRCCSWGRDPGKISRRSGWTIGMGSRRRSRRARGASDGGVSGRSCSWDRWRCSCWQSRYGRRSSGEL